MKRIIITILVSVFCISDSVVALNCPGTDTEKSSSGSLDSTSSQSAIYISGTFLATRRDATATFNYRWNSTRFGNHPVSCGPGTSQATIECTSVESSSNSVKWGLKDKIWGVGAAIEVGSSCSSVLTQKYQIQSSVTRSTTYKYEVNFYQQLCDIHVKYDNYKINLTRTGWIYVDSGKSNKYGTKTSQYKEETTTSCCNTQ